MALTHRIILQKWPHSQAVADDLGVKISNVRVWRHYNRIPFKHWQALIASAEKYGIRGITWAVLAQAKGPAPRKIPNGRAPAEKSA